MLKPDLSRSQNDQGRWLPLTLDRAVESGNVAASDCDLLPQRVPEPGPRSEARRQLAANGRREGLGLQSAGKIGGRERERKRECDQKLTS